MSHHLNPAPEPVQEALSLLARDEGADYTTALMIGYYGARELDDLDDALEAERSPLRLAAVMADRARTRARAHRIARDVFGVRS